MVDKFMRLSRWQFMPPCKHFLQVSLDFGEDDRLQLLVSTPYGSLLALPDFSFGGPQHMHASFVLSICSVMFYQYVLTRLMSAVHY